MDPKPGSMAQHMHELARENRDYLLPSWLSKARTAIVCRQRGEPLPAWSVGECLAVAVILDDHEMLTGLGYTRDDALDRIRWDIGASTTEAEEIIIGIRRDAGI